MCILFNGSVYKASDTLLIVTPLLTPPHLPQAWQLVYLNSITPTTSPFATQSLANPLMVVPIPNPHDLHELDFSMFSVPGHVATPLRDAASHLCQPYAPKDLSFSAPSSMPPSFFGAHPTPNLKPLQVQHVGSYNISVAPSLADLETRAPWTSFFVSQSDANLILSDLRSRYHHRKMAFVIAKGSRSTTTYNINNAGFAVLYRDNTPNPAFFPTSHEPNPSHSLVHMDVSLVALGAVIRPLSILSQNEHAKFRNRIHTDTENALLVRADDTFSSFPPKWKYVRQIHSLLPRIASGKNHSSTIVEPEIPTVATLWRLTGPHQNRDVVARKATMHDAAVVQRLYSDVDLWLRARNPHLHNSVQAFGIALPPLKRLDFVLSLLARQVADPGINDRRSDAPSHMSGITEDCAGVAYVNLDIPDIDLNEVAYYEKEGRARILVTDRNTVDTTGSTYVRVSATLGPWESFEMRTVQSPQKPQTGFNSHGIEAQ